ncbi:MAG: hypothetical protein Q9211_001185 [Gyalolechia sp. 1 TL-2023]
MLADVKLPFHPTAPDCLAWSEDGELAIAAGEFVHILVLIKKTSKTLIPRRGARRDQQNTSKPDPWVQISFRINSYTVDEWPTQKLNDHDSFCIGEEQSCSTVIALSWSPVGLAKHKRSALAVLATNHVLSLWASVSDMKTASTWERVLLVNKAFGTPDQRITPRDKGVLTSSGLLRRSARVQSMSWAPIKADDSAYYKNDPPSATSEICSRTQYLAVTNDADEVVILLVQSGCMHHSKSLWEAQIVCRLRWQDLRSLFSSPQIAHTQEDICGTDAASNFGWPSMFARSFSTIEHRRWKNMILSSDGDADSTVKIQSGAQDLQLTNEWDEISDYQLRMLQKEFDQHHDLGGVSIAKTWGLASWGPYVASCISFHPGDMVEYTLISAERCHIIFGLVDAAGAAVEDAEFPWQESSRSLHQGSSPDVQRKVLTVLTDQRLNDLSDRKVLYGNCCAAMIPSGTQNAELVEKALQQLVTSTGINLELEFNLLRATRDSNFSTASCIERLNEMATSRIGQEDLRCALTSLPIKEPGISKYCESCNREFLDESVLSQEAVNDLVERDGSTAMVPVDVGTTFESNPPEHELQLNGEASRRPVCNLGLIKALFTGTCRDVQRRMALSAYTAQQVCSTLPKLSSMKTSPTTTTDRKRISLSITKSAVPNIIQSPASPPTSLKANLSFADLMASSIHPSSRKPSIAASTGSSNKPNRTVDHFDIPSSPDEMGPDEQIAAHTLADFVDGPDDSPTAMKPPPPKHHFRSGSVSLGLSSEAASFATSSSPQQDASTRAIQSPRGFEIGHGSMRNAVSPPDARKRSVASGASSSSPDGFPASEAIATPDDGGSPTLGRFPAPPVTRVKKGKARDSMLLHRHSQTSDNSTKAAKERTPTINTQDTEAKAEKRLAIPFLPKFLKLAGSPRQSISTDQRDSIEITEVDEIPPKTQNIDLPKSAFESDSSDDDASQPYDENAVIGGAKLAASRKPKLVENRKSSGKRVVSMQDILKEGGIEAVADRLHYSGTSVLADADPGPSKSKATQILGESGIKMKRAGIVGMPAVRETNGGVQVSLDGAEEPVKGRSDWHAALTDGLRSNPVKRSMTAPAGKKFILPIKVSNEPRTLEESIVSTPYPLGYKTRLSGDEDSVTRPRSHIDYETKAGKDAASITLVLYSRSSTTPVLRKLVVPETKEVSLSDEDEKRPQFRARLMLDFDDEQLFRLIKKEYRGMRGMVKGLVSARGVSGISLLGYHRLSQLAIKEHRPNRRKTFRVYDDVFTEQRMKDLWTSPGNGRKKHEWVEWIRRLPRYSEGLHPDDEKVALELVEGWKVGKIASALLLVVALSLLATLLWTFLGTSGGVVLQNDAMVGYPMELRMNSAGFRGAGVRIETGLALGVLVLLLGWTGVGTWILLSWLVMIHLQKGHLDLKPLLSDQKAMDVQEINPRLDRDYVYIKHRPTENMSRPTEQPYQPHSPTVSISETEQWEKELMEDPKNRLALSALSANNAMSILTQRSAVISDTQNFNIKIGLEGAPITNQKSSGRCWLFAATNVFRVAVMKRYNLKEFELSQAYLFYWDKLEKANYFLEQILDTAEEDLEGRLMQTLLASPVGDGGQWDMVANLVEKYGLVPHSLYPDAFNAQNSRTMVSLITTKVREDALELRRLASRSPDAKQSLGAVKEKMMREIHLILTLMLGRPPNPDKEMTWEYQDKDDKFQSLVTTPLKFAGELSSQESVKANSGTNIHELFSLVNDPRNPYGKLLSVSRLGNVVGMRPVRYVNVDMMTMKKACISMLRADIPIFFGCDVGKFSDPQSGIMDTALFDYELGFNVRLGLAKAQRLMSHDSAMTHAMVLTAVHVIDGQSVRWRVQNSWGEGSGAKGWFVMSDRWMDEFVYQTVVDPRFVDKAVREVLKQKPTMLDPWDPMGALA